MSTETKMYRLVAGTKGTNFDTDPLDYRCFWYEEYPTKEEAIQSQKELNHKLQDGEFMKIVELTDEDIY